MQARYQPLAASGPPEAADIEEPPSNLRRHVTTKRSALCLVSALGLVVLLSILGRQTVSPHPDESLALTVNGTYRGLFLPQYEQYLFLGMPYAAPPVGDLRFRWPQPYNGSWNGVRDATEYGPRCITYGLNRGPFPQSEDCLTINVVRPASHPPLSPLPSLLPVAVYIYGGGRHGGHSADQRYNQSFLAAAAARAGLPFVAVSFNYRSSVWGFLSSREVRGAGDAANAGLHDQRLALRWVRANIRAFGGDPDKVTLWGGSSGADNVGHHLAAYDGGDSCLFRAAILQSGGPVARDGFRGAPAQAYYDALAARVGCAAANATADSLRCLRHAPFERLQRAFDDDPNADSLGMLVLGTPAIDGDFVRRYGSLSVKAGRMANVPILSGVVTDEGATWIPQGVETWADFRGYLVDTRKYPEPVVDKLLSFYEPDMVPDSSTLGPPIKPGPNQGVRERISMVLGDLEINAAQRLLCKAYSMSSACFSFRFDAGTLVNGTRTAPIHGDEIGPVFQNVDGVGFLSDPFKGQPQGYHDMTRIMGLTWASFITHMDPNTGLNTKTPLWPEYSAEGGPVNIVFNETCVSAIEPDTYRTDAMNYINEIQHSILDK